ncbi:MAG TPA: hypothetical protein VIY48_09285 [Candidatus Paceibacterota bacterium]
MATLSHRLHVLTDGSVEVCNACLPDAVELPEVLYRVNHDMTIWRPNLPEVFRLDPDHHVILTEAIQWLIRNMNPQLTDDQWRAVFGNATAFTNRTGFPGRHDYINKMDVNAHDPTFDQARVCGGALLKGIKGRDLKGDPALIIEAIDTRKPLPTAEYVMKRPWLYFEAINIDYSVELHGPILRPLKGRWHKPVYIPVLHSVNATYPLDLLTEIETINGIPSPYKYP